jgi:hypothetical protein
MNEPQDADRETLPAVYEPKYVERDGQLTVRPPYLQSDAFLMAWLVKADKAALQRIVDSTLNRPAKGAVDYRVLFSTVILSFADIARVSSLDPQDSHKGYTPEGDVCVWVVLGAYDDGKLDHIEFFLPYIWVTSPIATTIGREVYGFPKEFGWASMPTSATSPGPFWGDTEVLVHYSANTPITRQRLVEVSRDAALDPTLTAVDGLADATQTLFKKLHEMEGDFEDAPEFDWDFLWNLLKDVLGGHLPCVFLKQFRSATSPSAAAYQAIVEANATIRGIQGAGIVIAPWEVRFWQYASHRIIESLGVKPSSTVPLAMWVDFTFSMDLGRVVWSAT